MGGLFYFFFYAAGAALIPFLAVYYASLGISPAKIGLLASLTPLVSLFSAPLWGGLADSTRRHRLVLGSLMGMTLLSVALLSTGRGFWSVAPAVAAFAFFSSPVIPLVDHAVVTSLGEQSARYGRQRMWGAVGWGLVGLAAGALMDRLGLRISFGVYLGLFSLALIPALRLPEPLARAGSSYWSEVRRLLSDRRWPVFLAVVVLAGMSGTMIHSFFFLYLQELGASRTLMGASLTLSTLSEIPVLFFSDRLLRRWGARGMLAISLAILAARMLAYSATGEPWVALAISVVHGLTFSLLWAAGVSYAGLLAPAGLGATAQGLFGSAYFGLGSAAGALSGGLLFQTFGGTGMYRVAGLATLVAAVFAVVVFRKKD